MKICRKKKTTYVPISGIIFRHVLYWCWYKATYVSVFLKCVDTFQMCRHISYLSYDNLTQYSTVVFNGFFLNHVDRLKNVSTHLFPLFNSRWDKIKLSNWFVLYPLYNISSLLYNRVNYEYFYKLKNFHFIGKTL